MDFTYLEMIQSAMAEGKTSEETMWKSVDSISHLLEDIKYEYPELYWKFMRRQYGLLHNKHYGETFANCDVSKLRYTDRDGEKKQGGHWSVDEIEEATRGMAFPEGTTRFDKYVAFNAAYADFCRILSDEDIIRTGHSFFFADEDWTSRTKVWDYFCCMN